MQRVGKNEQNHINSAILKYEELAYKLVNSRLHIPIVQQHQEEFIQDNRAVVCQAVNRWYRMGHSLEDPMLEFYVYGACKKTIKYNIQKGIQKNLHQESLEREFRGTEEGTTDQDLRLSNDGGFDNLEYEMLVDDIKKKLSSDLAKRIFTFITSYGYMTRYDRKYETCKALGCTAVQYETAYVEIRKVMRAEFGLKPRKWVCRTSRTAEQRERMRQAALKMWAEGKLNRKQAIDSGKQRGEKLRQYYAQHDHPMKGKKKTQAECTRMSDYLRKYYETHSQWNKGKKFVK